MCVRVRVYVCVSETVCMHVSMLCSLDDSY